jgi:hypothetical protein
MLNLAEAIRLIEEQVIVERARCAIADNGFPGESSLLGTRDGYLNLVLALLRFVADVDAGDSSIPEGGFAWDDRVKAALYQLPTHSAWLVGAYLFKDHVEFMAALNRIVDPQIGYPLLNDPQFQSPGTSLSLGYYLSPLPGLKVPLPLVFALSPSPPHTLYLAI